MIELKAPEPTVKRIFFTDKQREFLAAAEPRVAWVGSRGSGKTRTTGFKLLRIIGGSTADGIAPMPRSKGMLVGKSYAQLETKELPEMKNALAAVGYQEYRRGTVPQSPYLFVYGHKPPSFFGKPLVPPEDYNRVLSFMDGCCLELITLNAKDGARGGSYDYAIVTEAAFLNGTRYNTEVKPMLRGVAGKYSSPYYLSETMTTSMPWTSRGQWVFDTEALAHEEPAKYRFIQSNVYDSLSVYGFEQIEQWRREVCAKNPLIWEVEYMNKRLVRPSNAYYPRLDADIHAYGVLSDGTDAYYQAAEPLLLSFDFNSELFTVTVHQFDGYIISTQSEFFDEKSLESLCRQFVETYAQHLQKVVHLYGDINGYYMRVNNLNDVSAYNEITTYLQRQGWAVLDKINYQPNPEHYRRYQAINTTLVESAGISQVIIRINEKRCAFTLRSLLATPINPDFTKDKSSEKDKLLNPREATHASDTCDYVWFRLIEQNARHKGTPYMPGL